MTGDATPAPSAIDRIRNDPGLRTRDDTGVWAIGLGTIAWIIAAIVVLIAGENLTTAESATRWLQICLAGAGLGAIGFLVVWFRHRRIRSAQDRARRS